MDKNSSQFLSGHLAKFVSELRFDDLPEDVVELATKALLDTVGCALAGSATGELSRLRRAIARAGETTHGSGLWGSKQTAPLPLAALANGAASHAREIDDFGGCAHSGAVVVPAALGMAISKGASGRQLLTAIVAGYDIAHRVMDGGGGYLAFKEVGWHSTSTCGVFGAAAAVASLLALDQRQTQWALGYAGSGAGGTWAFIPEGAMSKRVHPGLAAQQGMLSAFLAAEGVTAPESILEAPWGGYYPTYVGDRATPERAIADLGEDFRIRLIGFKPYAACRGIHSSLDVVLGMRSERGIKPDDVESVLVRGSPTHQKQLSKQRVGTTLDAQMSLPYSIAVALQTGGAMFDQYTDAMLQRPEITKVAEKVRVTVDPTVADGAEPFVDVKLRDGTTLTDRVLIARGDPENPLSEGDLIQKFRSTAGVVFDRPAVDQLEQAMLGISELADVNVLSTMLSGPLN